MFKDFDLISLYPNYYVPRLVFCVARHPHDMSLPCTMFKVQCTFIYCLLIFPNISFKLGKGSKKGEKLKNKAFVASLEVTLVRKGCSQIGPQLTGPRLIGPQLIGMQLIGPIYLGPINWVPINWAPRGLCVSMSNNCFFRTFPSGLG